MAEGSSSKLPASARVVIVGGGVMGCGLAYHLAHEGWSDVVLLEKAELTSGSTWHAAGQITHSTSSFGLGKCVDYNIGLYAGKLEEETGQSCGVFQPGSLTHSHWRQSQYLSHKMRRYVLRSETTPIWHKYDRVSRL